RIPMATHCTWPSSIGAMWKRARGSINTLKLAGTVNLRNSFLLQFGYSEHGGGGQSRVAVLAAGRPADAVSEERRKTTRRLAALCSRCSPDRGRCIELMPRFWSWLLERSESLI